MELSSSLTACKGQCLLDWIPFHGKSYYTQQFSRAPSWVQSHSKSCRSSFYSTALLSQHAKNVAFSDGTFHGWLQSVGRCCKVKSKCFSWWWTLIVPLCARNSLAASSTLLPSRCHRPVLQSHGPPGWVGRLRVLSKPCHIYKYCCEPRNKP